MKGIFGDWDKAISGLAKGAKTFNKIMQEALLEEGHFYRKKIIEGSTRALLAAKRSHHTHP